MNILKRIWSWVTQPAQQPVQEELKDECCVKCDCAPVFTQPSDSVAEFYKNDEGYAKAVYAVEEDALVVSTPVPETKKARKPAVQSKTTTTKKTQVKQAKPTPSKKVPPKKKPAPKKK